MVNFFSSIVFPVIPVLLVPLAMLASPATIGSTTFVFSVSSACGSEVFTRMLSVND